MNVVYQVELKMSGVPRTIGDPRTGLCNPEKNLGPGAVFCLIQGMVLSRIQETGNFLWSRAKFW